MPIYSIGYQATAPGTGAAAAAYTGDSLTILNLGQPEDAAIIAAWAYNNAAGWHQLTWPSAHDTTRGIRIAVPATTLTIWQKGEPYPRIRPGETIAATIAGSSTAGQIEQGILTIYSPSLPSITQHLIDDQTLASRAKKITTVYLTLTPGTSGGWSGEELITAESDLLLAGKEYAWLGAIANAGNHTIYIRSPETSGLRIACPAAPNANQTTAAYFVNLAKETGLPVIPVIRTDNRANTYVGASTNQAGASITASLLLAQLE